MLFSAVTNKITNLIQSQAAKNNTAIVEEIQAAAERPRCLETDGPMRRAYYEGHHQEHFKTFLRTVYPEAMLKGEIHPVGVNYVRTQAETDADVYRKGEPKRVGATEAETQRLTELTAQARTATELPEMEVRSVVGRAHFARIQRNPSTDRLEITKHWPHSTWFLSDPSAPAALECCSVALLQMGKDLFELWTKTPAGWDAQQIGTGENPFIRPLHAGGIYPGRLPIVAMYATAPTDGPYALDDGGLIDTANDYMLAWTELFHLSRHQAHSPLYISSMDDNVRLNGGPGGVTMLGPDGTMGAVQVEARMDESRRMINDFSGAIARSRSQSPRAYVTDPSPLNSAVALRVDNQLTEEKRPQRVELMKQFELFDLLPVLDEVDRLQPAQNARNRIRAATIDFRKVQILFPKNSTIEDTSQKQNRLAQAVREGMISRARAAVEAGYYEDEETALEAIKDLTPSDELVEIQGAPMRGPTSSTPEQP